jgi:hypothetical protein
MMATRVSAASRLAVNFLGRPGPKAAIAEMLLRRGKTLKGNEHKK